MIMIRGWLENKYYGTKMSRKKEHVDKIKGL
jgi:hypothetical protein